MTLHYLEIVTPDVDAVRAAYERIHGLAFDPPAPGLGNAVVADLAGGGKLGIRAPMSDVETPIVRTYLRVDDLAGAVEHAAASGAEIALPPTELEGGLGTIAIYIHGGAQHGLWQI